MRACVCAGGGGVSLRPCNEAKVTLFSYSGQV